MYKNENILLLNKYKEIDLLFSIITINPPLTETELLDKFKEVVDNLDNVQVITLLQTLITDKHIIKNHEEKFVINILSKDFTGYFYQEMIKNASNLITTAIEKRYKKAPIIVAIFFGLTTAYFSYVNYHLSKQKLNTENNLVDKDKIIRDKDNIIISKDSIIENIIKNREKQKN